MTFLHQPWRFVKPLHYKLSQDLCCLIKWDKKKPWSTYTRHRKVPRILGHIYKPVTLLCLSHQCCSMLLRSCKDYLCDMDHYLWKNSFTGDHIYLACKNTCKMEKVYIFLCSGRREGDSSLKKNTPETDFIGNIRTNITVRAIVWIGAFTLVDVKLFIISFERLVPDLPSARSTL